MAPRYSFPILERKQIISSIAELGGPTISNECLLRPIPEAILPVVEFLVQYMEDGITGEESQQLDFEALDILGNPDLYADSLYDLMYFMRLRKLMNTSLDENFSPLELYKPDSQKIIRILSAAINSCKYRNSKIDFFVQLQSSREQEMLKTAELQEEFEQLQDEIDAIEEDRMSHQPQVEALDAEVKELGHRISTLNKQQSSLQSDTKSLKQENNNYADKIANANFLLMQKQQENAQLLAKIVENPDKLQKKLEGTKASLQEEEIKGADASQSFRNLRLKSDFLLKVEKKLGKHEQILQLLDGQVTTEKEAEKDVKALRSMLRNLEKEWAMNVKRNDLLAEGQRISDILEKFDQQKGQKIEEVLRDRRGLEAWKEQMKEHFSNQRQELTECREQEDIIERRAIELDARKEERIGKLHAVHAVFEKELEYFNTSLLSSLAFDLNYCV